MNQNQGQLNKDKDNLNVKQKDIGQMDQKDQKNQWQGQEQKKQVDLKGHEQAYGDKNLIGSDKHDLGYKQDPKIDQQKNMNLNEQQKNQKFNEEKKPVIQDYKKDVNFNDQNKNQRMEDDKKNQRTEEEKKQQRMDEEKKHQKVGDEKKPVIPEQQKNQNQQYGKK